MLAIATLIATQIFTFGQGSRLWVEGDSSLHPWSCQAPASDVRIEIEKDAPELVRALTLRVPVSRIECGNGTMNDKVREALHAEQFPVIEYRLTQAERMPAPALKLEATGDLTINGKTHRAIFQVDVKPLPDGTAQATGSIVMLMSDFAVEPPTAMLGMLRTSDQITIKFEIHTTPRGVARASLH